MRESAQRALMEALAASGSYAAATQLYRDLRVLLHRELNAEPAPETHASYEALGTPVGQQALDLREGATERVALRAQNTIELTEQFCPGRRLRRDRGVLRVTAVDSATSRPLANMQVWLRWVGGYVGRGEALTARTSGVEQRTDKNGRAAFCDVPLNTPLTLSAVNALGHPARDSMMVRMTVGGVIAAQLRTRRP